MSDEFCESIDSASDNAETNDITSDIQGDTVREVTEDAQAENEIVDIPEDVQTETEQESDVAQDSPKDILEEPDGDVALEISEDVYTESLEVEDDEAVDEIPEDVDSDEIEAEINSNREEWLERLKEADEKIAQAGEGGSPEIDESLAYKKELIATMEDHAQAYADQTKMELHGKEVFTANEEKIQEYWEALDRARAALREQEMLKNDIKRNTQ